MKKLLVAASITALGFVSGVAQANEPGIEIGSGGYMAAYGVYADQDETGGDDLRKSDFRKNTEVHLDGNVALDNGVTAGMHMQLLNDRADAGSVIEESYLHVSSSYGRVELGETDGAGYKLQVVAPSADKLVDGVSPKISAFTAANGGTIDYKMNPSGYANKITYFTPVFNGFQAGATYVPQVNGGDLSGIAAADSTNDAGHYDDMWEVAARYEVNLGAVDVTAGATYQAAGLEANAGTNQDFESWGAGLNAEFGPVNLGMFYSLNNNVQRHNDTNLWVFGANYELGAYTFGASYLNTHTDDPAGLADPDTDRYTLGVVYEWGPGMSFRGSVQRQMAENVGRVAGANGQATQMLLGTVIEF